MIFIYFRALYTQGFVHLRVVISLKVFLKATQLSCLTSLVIYLEPELSLILKEGYRYPGGEEKKKKKKRSKPPSRGKENSAIAKSAIPAVNKK